MKATEPVATIGTLGGPATFAGQAAAIAAAGLGDPPVSFYASMDDVWEATLAADVEISVLTAETSWTNATETNRKLASRGGVFVVGEVVVGYHCALLGKAGTNLANVKQVLGHGSLRQCSAFLERELPWAEVRVHDESSIVAARQVWDGDGSSVVVGTLAAAEQLGLVVLAEEIDDGSEGSWWLLSSEPRHADRPDTVVVTGPAGPRAASLSQVFGALQDLGFLARSVQNFATGRLHVYDYVSVFSHPAPGVDLDSVETVIGSLEDVRLVGAFSTDAVLPAAGVRVHT